jgi:hypothetical protein
MSLTRTLLLFVILVGSRFAAADHVKLVVVVAKGSTVTNISKSDLRHCFLGDTVSNGDAKLNPFNAEPRTATRVAFDRAVLSMSPDDIGRYWIERKVRGQSGAPRALPSYAIIQKVVVRFPNAISYVPVDHLTADLQPVKIDGTAYSDASYSIFTE